jgi:hypothetical protein
MAKQYRHLQRSGVAKCRSNVVGDAILWREVDLLEELWGNRQTSGGPEPPQRMFFVVVIMVKVVLGIAIDGVAPGMVFLGVWKVGHVAVNMGIGLSSDYVVMCFRFVYRRLLSRSRKCSMRRVDYAQQRPDKDSVEKQTQKTRYRQ